MKNLWELKQNDFLVKISFEWWMEKQVNLWEEPPVAGVRTCYTIHYNYIITKEGRKKFATVFDADSIAQVHFRTIKREKKKSACPSPAAIYENFTVYFSFELIIHFQFISRFSSKNLVLLRIVLCCFGCIFRCFANRFLANLGWE